MPPTFFEHPILNSPYEYPSRHWELKDGQSTENIIENRRPAEFITPGLVMTEGESRIDPQQRSGSPEVPYTP